MVALCLVAAPGLLLPGSAAAAAPTATTLTGAGHTVEIQRTEYGIPHILADNYENLGYGYGYAFAQDNLCEMADRVLTLRGERSEYLGPSAPTDDTLAGTTTNLASDIYYQGLRQAGTVQRLIARPAPLGPTAQLRQLVDGYVDGYNRYLRDTGVAHLPDATCRGKAWVTPITALDVWSNIYDITRVAGAAGFKGDIAAATPPKAGTTARTTALALPTSSSGNGSNAWALGRTATRAHDGMLLANPHLPWLGDSRFYQVQLTIPGVLDVSGASLYGTPVVEIGHTNGLAWTQTTSYAPHAELYQLSLVPGDPTSYLVDGRAVAMSRRTVRVTVLGADGKLSSVASTLYSSRYGPVLAPDWTSATAYSIYDANADNVRAVNEWLAMDMSQSIGQLRAAQQTYQGIPWDYTTAVDASGTTYFTDSSLVPHITDAQLQRCTVNTPDISGALNGSTTACDPGSDPDAIEPGVYGPGEEPSLTRDDYVANSNNDPTYTNPSAPLTGYPDIYYTGPGLALRPQLGLQMIAQRLDGTDGLGAPGFTLPTLQTVMLNDRDRSAEFGRDDAVAMCRSHPVLTASDGARVDVRAACAVLAAWDLRADPDSAGAVLWSAFFTPLGGGDPADWALVPYDPAQPLTTPRGINGSDATVQQSLADAVQQLAALHLPLDATPAQAQRWDGIPLLGCTDEEGCFNIVYASPTSGGSGGIDPSPANDAQGSSFIMATELTPTGPRTRTILTYSESSNPSSPHYADQTVLFSEKRWVTERFTQAEIDADPQLETTVLDIP